MKFSNPKVPEDINVSRRNPLADLVIWSGGVLICLAILAGFLIWLGGALARHMPVAWENALADQFIDTEIDADDAALRKKTVALQKLAQSLALHIPKEPDTRVIVHYVDSDTVNAFATAGGHIFMMRGLVERLPHENALAMVLAHEIGHVANRDAASQLGGMFMLRAVMAVVFGSGAENLGGVLTTPEALVVRGFSRDAEDEADEAALAAVAAHSGHVEGAAALFEVLQEAHEGEGESPYLEWLRTHPLTQERHEQIATRAAAEGWPQSGPLTPMPAILTAASTDPD